MSPSLRRVAITCGPGYEPIDAVRRLTNFSTGALGAQLASRFLAQGFRVLMFRGEMATALPPNGLDVRPFSTGADLLIKIRRALRETDEPFAGFFHAAALSDFRVASARSEAQPYAVGRGKIPTSSGHLTLRLEPVPKILPQLRSLLTDTLIVGWKYEVEGDRNTALQKAADQIRECKTDLCVVNGPAFGPGFGVLDAQDVVEEASGADKLFMILRKHLQAHI